jgi:GT2 family glycosyltransferase
MADSEVCGSTDQFTVVIVTFNSAHCIAALAKGLAEMPHVIVIDNASDDETLSQIDQKLPHAKLIVNARNLGFGAANNLALRQVTTPYALLLNPDCIPNAPFFVDLIEAAAMFPDATVIAPHLLRRDGEVELSYRWPSSLWKSRGPKADGPCSVGFVCGAAMLLKMSAMEKIGLFDESFFLYYEDEDLCQRIFMAKENIVLVPKIEIAHLSRSSVKGRNPLKSEFQRGFHHVQSKLLFKRKYFGASSSNVLRLTTLALALVTLIPRLLIPHPRYLARLLGRIAGLLFVGPKLKTLRPLDQFKASDA